jgi:hypothetical protein
MTDLNMTHSKNFEEQRLALMEELGGDTGADLAGRQRAVQAQTPKKVSIGG